MLQIHSYLIDLAFIYVSYLFLALHCFSGTIISFIKLCLRLFEAHLTKDSLVYDWPASGSTVRGRNWGL